LIQSQQQKAAIFFDTNIALHYQRLDQIDWPGTIGYKHAEIVVTSVVLSELDKHKTENFSKKLRKRAAEYGAWLLEKFSSPSLNRNVSLIFRPNEPMLDFAQHQLDGTILDDRLIATVIEFANEFPERPVVVVTADLGLILKLKMRSISVSSLPEKFRLADEADADEIEMKNLRSQLARYTNRAPKLTLTFTGGEQVLEVAASNFVPKEAFVAEKMAAMRARYPLMTQSGGTLPSLNAPNGLAKDFSVSIGQAISSLSHSQQSLYNNSLERFYVEYENYVEDFYDYAVRNSVQISLPLFLCNLEGTAPATGIDVILKSPDGTSFINARMDRPTAPTAPEKPSSPFDLSFNRHAVFIPPPIPDFRKMMRENASDQPKLTLSGNSAQFFVPSLKHKQTMALLPIFLDFGSAEGLRSITLSFEIHAHEILDPVHQQLHLKLPTQ
jgi:rRNA-processing protein FCF1